jgi:hypothetical protein
VIEEKSCWCYEDDLVEEEAMQAPKSLLADKFWWIFHGKLEQGDEIPTSMLFAMQCRCLRMWNIACVIAGTHQELRSDL